MSNESQPAKPKNLGAFNMDETIEQRGIGARKIPKPAETKVPPKAEPAKES